MLPKWAALFSASKEDMDNLRVVNTRLYVICSADVDGLSEMTGSGHHAPQIGIYGLAGRGPLLLFPIYQPTLPFQQELSPTSQEMP